MALLSFIGGAMLISLSGVMAPGPMTAAAVTAGEAGPRGGIRLALGHGLVEFPLMALLYFGFTRYLQGDAVMQTLGIIGGIFMLYMAFGLFSSLKSMGHIEAKGGTSPLIDGALLSLGNPYFILWWATVGSALIITAKGFGITGFLIFAIAHWMCDLVWFTFLSGASHQGAKKLGSGFLKTVSAISGIVLVIFALYFLYDALSRPLFFLPFR